MHGLEQILQRLAPEALSNLATTVLENPSVGVSSSLPPRSLFSALFQLVPPEDRLKVSFTTGLRHSPRRPFRFFLLPSDPTARRQFQRQSNVTVVELPPQSSSQKESKRMKSK